MNIDEIRRLMEEQFALSRRLKARVSELETEIWAPLAVVGMALRFPGGITSPEAYWDFLRGDDYALSDIPQDRPGLRAVYDAAPGKPGCSYVKRAGFLDDVGAFDARFFGISKREAEALDPQQRLLLETSWEAMERAGIAVPRGQRLNVGVFIGIMASEYGERRLGHADKSGIDPYFGTGGGHCFAAGRVSYVMGFSGPAMSVDTACSSSLVALHLASQSLRRRECRYAIVGGTNLLFSGDLMVSLCQSRAVAVDGRSKTFTASADGYGRGEGIGSLALMRLDEAEREGRPILAVLRGTAVNHDGASSGLTVPSGPAQREVIQAALADAGVPPEEVGYVEAHGTGTALGDPIEVNALDATLGTGATARHVPLHIGNVKSRIGHLEAAAGIAGVMKVVLALQNGEIPAALTDADGPLNSMIAWDRMPIVVPRRSQIWPAGFEKRLAGVSAFGLSGTNAHAVFEAYAPAAAVAPAASPRSELVVLSARDAESLQGMVRALTPRFADCEGTALASVAHTLRVGRVVFPVRVAATGASGNEIAAALEVALSMPVAAGIPQPKVELRLSTATGVLEAGLATLAHAFPLLVPPKDQSRSARGRFEDMLKLLGIRARIIESDMASPPAQLIWNGVGRPLVNDDTSASPKLLLDALAALFIAGANLSLDALRAREARLVGDLPTYPFRRERFWIDEIAASLDMPGHDPAKGREDSEREETDRAAVESFVEAELRELLRAEGEFDRAQTFLDVGGDSFIAMLLKKAIEQRYEIDLPFEALATDLALATLYSRVGDVLLRAPISLIERAAE
jgi:3-oxoacyl-[acyl-carrier-protein] synthase II